MKSIPYSLFLVTAFFAGSSAPAQRVPVTTTSHEVRERFEQGRQAAFHFRFEHAVEQFEAALAADPDFALAHIYRGGSTRSADIERRRYHFDRAFELRDRVSEGEQLMIDAFRSFLWEEDHERAVEIFSRLSEDFPDDPFIPAHLALRYFRALERYEEAVKHFRRAVERDPAFAPARNWLGHALLRSGRTEEAEEILRESLQRHSDDPYTHDFIGEVYLEWGRFDEAAGFFQRALEIDPTFEYSRTNLLRVDLERVKARFREAFGQGDAAAISDLYTVTALLLPVGTAVQGPEGIRQNWQEVLDAGVCCAELETFEVFPGAEETTVTEVGLYRLTAGDEEADSGRYVAIWQRTEEGWKLHRHIWTSDRAPGR